MTEVAHPEVATGYRRLAIAVVLLRFAIPLAAIPAIPFLIRDRVTLLVLLRPQKEFLLVGGAQSRVLGDPGILALFLAYLPLGVLSIGGFFLAGRAYRRALRSGSGPRWLHRAIPPQQLELGQRVLARRGPVIALIGRLAAMPPTVLAAAAGLSDVDPRRYLLADLVGAILGFAMAAGAGFALGRAYEQGGVWLTAVGVALFVGILVLLTRWIHREGDRQQASDQAAAEEAAEPEDRDEA